VNISKDRFTCQPARK